VSDPIAAQGADPDAEQRFAILCKITRAQHFAWREAVRQTCPDIDPAAVVRSMWEITGAETARAYSRRIDVTRPLAEQVAASVAWSSRCMGEEVSVEPGAGGDEAFLRHTACPWFDWHQRLGLLEEDRPGCDRWFATTVEHLNAALGTHVHFETLETLPDGDPCCRRRFWVEEGGAGQ
jgi:hypothetical protein